MLEHEQISTLRRMIEKRRALLTGEAQSDAARVRDERFASVAGEVHDAADESVANVVQDTNQAELSRDLMELRDLDAALARLLTGTYGRCPDCQGDVGFERLCAEPAALRCIDCQRARDKLFTPRATPKL